MNYAEVKTNLKALAFEEDETIEEYIENDVIPTAINRAITMIAEDFPIIKTYEIDQDGTDDEYNFYDFTTEVNDFLSFGEHPVRIDDGDKYETFGDYTIEKEDTLVIPGDVEGTFRVFYNASFTEYDPDGNMESTELPLRARAHHLVPLLAAYYVWLDDDATKASQYYNSYEQQASILITRAQAPRGRILSGGI